jgi:hypothetical protein
MTERVYTIMYDAVHVSTNTVPGSLLSLPKNGNNEMQINGSI